VYRTALLTDYFKKTKVTNVVLCDVTFFTLNNHVVCEMCKYKFIYMCRKITAFHATLFKQLSNIRTIFPCHLYQMSYKLDNKCGKCV